MILTDTTVYDVLLLEGVTIVKEQESCWKAPFFKHKPTSEILWEINGTYSNLTLFHSYFVQVTADVLGTIQFQTSKPDVLIRLSVLDQEKEVAGNTGKGHVVIPVFCFLADKGET